MDKSFAKRNYGKDYGELYKPDLTDNAARNKIDDDLGVFDTDDDNDDGFGASFGGQSGFPSMPTMNGSGFPSMPATDGQTDGSGFPAFPAQTEQGDGEAQEDEECLAKYHEYLRKLSEEYALGGGLEAALGRIRAQIDALVETDPTAFCTYEEYASSAESLKTAIHLRAESVLGQISGEIPSTKEGQAAEPEKLLDTGDADLSGLTSGYGMGMNTFTMPNFPGKK